MRVLSTLGNRDMWDLGNTGSIRLIGNKKHPLRHLNPASHTEYYSLAPLISAAEPSGFNSCGENFRYPRSAASWRDGFVSGAYGSKAHRVSMD